MSHPWRDPAGDPWDLDSESDQCADCGGTPDEHFGAMTPVSGPRTAAGRALLARITELVSGEWGSGAEGDAAIAEYPEYADEILAIEAEARDGLDVAALKDLETALIRAFPVQGSYNRIAVWQAIQRVFAAAYAAQTLGREA